MKLYTEYQVREILKKAFWQDFNEGDTEQSIISELTPIELPSDDEIKRNSILWGYAGEFYYKGAKWMRDKIKVGNK